MESTIFLPDSVPKVAIEALAQGGLNEIEIFSAEQYLEILDKIRPIDAVGFNGPVPDRLPRECLAIGQYSVGLQGLNLGDLRKRGVPVFEAHYENARSIAESVVGSIYTLAQSSSEIGFEIRNKTLGIVGFGNVGRQLATLAEANNLHVVYINPEETLSPGQTKSANSLKELLEQSDFVSIHTDKYVFGPKELSHLKKGGFLINTFNGVELDYATLVKMVKNGDLGGAAIDAPYLPEVIAQAVGEGERRILYTRERKARTIEAIENAATVVSKRLADYVLNGVVESSATLPNIRLDDRANGSNRIAFIHDNHTGAKAELDALLGERGFNITASALSTRGEVGYGLVDVEPVSSEDVARLFLSISALSSCIRARVI